MSSDTSEETSDTPPTGNPDNVPDEVTTSDPTKENIEYEFEDDTTRLQQSWRNFADRWVHTGIQAKRVSPSMFEDIEDAVETGGGRVIRVDPYPDNSSISGSEKLLDELHDSNMKWRGLVNASETHGFEIWFNDGKISFYFYVRSKRAETKFKKQLDAFYPDAQLHPIHGNPRKQLPKNQDTNTDDVENDTDSDRNHAESWWDDRFLPVYDGDYAATARLESKRSYFFPIRTTSGLKPFDDDPYKALTSELSSDDLDRTMIQVLFQPADESWDTGKLGASVLPTRTNTTEIVDHLNDGTFKNFISSEKKPPDNDAIGVSKIIESLASEKAYHTNIRVTSFSPYKDRAEQNVWGIASSFESEYASSIGHGDNQTLEIVPGSGKTVDEMLLRSARREWKDCGTLLTVPELAGVAHIPNDTIETPAITWSQTGKGARPPAGMPRFDEPAERLPPGVRKQRREQAQNTDSQDTDTDHDSEDTRDDGTRDTHAEREDENANTADTNTGRTTEPDSTPDLDNDVDTDTDDGDVDDGDAEKFTKAFETEEDDENENGIIAASFTPDDTDDENTNNATGADDIQTNNNTPDSPSTETEEDSQDNTSEREDPTPTTSSSNEMSNGYNKNISFGSNDEDKKDEETNT